MKCFLLVTLLVYCLHMIEAYNILVTVIGISGSQNLIMYRLAEILGKRGHQVTIFKREIFPEAKTVKLEYVKEEIVYKITNDSEIINQLQEKINSISWSSSRVTMHHLKMMTLLFGTLSTNCEGIMQDEQLLSRLKSKRYDVIVIHMLDFCSFGMAHHLGIKGTVWMSTAFMVDFMGWYSNSPTTPSYVVSSVNTVFDEMNFLERFKNSLLTSFIQALFQYGVVSTYSDLFQSRFGSEFPSFGQLLANTQLFYINSDPFFEYPRPVPHNVIYIGGLTMKNAEPLTEEWQKIVDDAGDAGVVVFSLGSVANTATMPNEMKKAFINAFKRIPQKVIWRLQGDTSEARKVPNIYVSDWLPQKDLVGNLKVKALITHGGYNSLTEATYLGVPLVMFPLFGDQYSNCKRVERLKVGVILPRDNLNEDSILKALNSVLNSEEIQSNARRLGRMIRSKPDSSNDLAIKWIEFLAEFQNLDQLKPVSGKLNLIQYLLIDVAFTIVFVFILLSYIMFICCKCCCKKLCKRKHNKIE